MEERLLNLQQIEQLTGFTFKTIKKRLQSAGIKPKRKKGQATLYDTYELLPAIYQKQSSDAEQLTVERARLAKVQAGKIKVETERLLGKLVDREEWCKDWSAMIIDFKNKLLSFPLKVTPQLVGKESDEIYAILQENLIGEINDLATESQKKADDIKLELDANASLEDSEES